MGTSLWLVPSQEAASKLEIVMKTETGTSQSPSSFPPFDPHITLVTVPSTTSLDELRAAIPADQPVVPVTFKRVEIGHKYFMSVYVTVHHAAELNALRDALGKALGEQTVPPVAHVSLFYIDDSEPEERQKAYDILEKEGRIVDRGEDHVALDCADGEPESREPDLLDGFEGSEIWIAVCDGPVPTWVVKDRIKLSRL
ncbi:hypothetical protein PHLGIDRAFT_477889 [Phlebiopsis gigantea 11061_1 CR5-6]|uniref:2',3'-cyclic-nucleotide 3'-phosphodiesterase n=1 Tax=Phlebiopsis gigantea (strain 11061_1 CR5-6) TaxID=745531 RepID=A0A0C3NLW8_PHLG1|nr:hypothetical protein PHLGIDRAFT_477889 [Phlebiopsis gigantea 11061_1 CR5-6]